MLILLCQYERYLGAEIGIFDLGYPLIRATDVMRMVEIDHCMEWRVLAGPFSPPYLFPTRPSSPNSIVKMA